MSSVSLLIFPLALLDFCCPWKVHVKLHWSQEEEEKHIEQSPAKSNLPPKPKLTHRRKSYSIKCLSLLVTKLGSSSFYSNSTHCKYCQQTELNISHVTLLKKLLCKKIKIINNKIKKLLCSYQDGYTEDQMPSLKKLLKSLLKRQKKRLIGIVDVLYTKWKNLFLIFTDWVFALVSPVSILAFCCPLWPIVHSISTSQVQPDPPRMALLKIPSFIFSYCEPLMTFNSNFLKQTRSPLFMGACYLWSSLLNMDVTSKVLNNNCGSFLSVAVWATCKAIYSKWRLCH